MARWLLGSIAGLLALCVVCVAAGYFAVLPRIRDTISDGISNEIAWVIEFQVNSKLISNRTPATQMFDEQDLDINSWTSKTGGSGFTYSYSSGDSGFDVVGDSADIYGAATSIQGDRIAIDFSGMTWSAVPVVDDGLISLEEIDFERHIAGHAVSADAITAGIESGINNALVKNERRVTSLSLQDGALVVSFD